MNLRESDKIYGIPSGVEYRQHERVDELNTRIQQRQLPDHPIKPQYDIRAVSTKYSVFPIIDRRIPEKEERIPYLEHSVQYSFAPNIKKGPSDFFYNRIDEESGLRNQFFALQKGADQSVYVPSSTSDLYVVPVYGRKEEQPYPFISKQFKSDPIPRPNVDITGRDLFNNCTRVQLRGGSDQ